MVALVTDDDQSMEEVREEEEEQIEMESGSQSGITSSVGQLKSSESDER
jgi:hypothetical protein